MSTRSRIVTVLPEDVRAELDQKLVAGAFGDYSGLERWLRSNGFQISRSALQRYGSKFEKRVAAIARATAQSKAMVEASPDREGAMTDALSRLIQEKIFGVLLDSEEAMSDGQLSKLARAVAELARSTVTQRRWAEEIRERLDEQKRTATEKISGVEKRGGLSHEAAEAIRNALLDIDPL